MSLIRYKITYKKFINCLCEQSNFHSQNYASSQIFFITPILIANNLSMSFIHFRSLSYIKNLLTPKPIK